MGKVCDGFVLESSNAQAHTSIGLVYLLPLFAQCGPIDYPRMVCIQGVDEQQTTWDQAILFLLQNCIKWYH
jgi:hypothetical protein